MQDLIRAVRGAGSYDARLMLQSEGFPDKLTDALASLKGVRSPGQADGKGVRLVTFVMDERTMYADLESAGSQAGAKIFALKKK
ncbi:MAG: hypothetical protein QOJ65_1769 [Fimbriimonadaceae bacterium]|jgi:hypothetical protein|nr:hypothetical protein [Fimbriimonadaceae bacterium]